jgi:hypothetical protein
VAWFVAARLLGEVGKTCWEQGDRRDVQEWMAWLLDSDATAILHSSTGDQGEPTQGRPEAPWTPQSVFLRYATGRPITSRRYGTHHVLDRDLRPRRAARGRNRARRPDRRAPPPRAGRIGTRRQPLSPGDPPAAVPGESPREHPPHDVCCSLVRLQPVRFGPRLRGPCSGAARCPAPDQRRGYDPEISATADQLDSVAPIAAALQHAARPAGRATARLDTPKPQIADSGRLIAESGVWVAARRSAGSSVAWPFSIDRIWH